MQTLATACYLLVGMVCPLLAAPADVASGDWTKSYRAPPQGSFQIAQAAPAIATLTPTSGRIGTKVTIQGSGFTLDNMIHFRGTPDSFDIGPVRSDNGVTLQFEVNTCPTYQPQCPARYVTPGSYGVAVSNANGRSKEAKFTLTARTGWITHNLR